MDLINYYMLNNRANQLNPNNFRFWASRGADVKNRRELAEFLNIGKRLIPNHLTHWSIRASAAKPALANETTKASGGLISTLLGIGGSIIYWAYVGYIIYETGKGAYQLYLYAQEHNIKEEFGQSVQTLCKYIPIDNLRRAPNTVYTYLHGPAISSFVCDGARIGYNCLPGAVNMPHSIYTSVQGPYIRAQLGRGVNSAYYYMCGPAISNRVGQSISATYRYLYGHSRCEEDPGRAFYDC